MKNHDIGTANRTHAHGHTDGAAKHRTLEMCALCDDVQDGFHIQFEFRCTIASRKYTAVLHAHTYALAARPFWRFFFIVIVGARNIHQANIRAEQQPAARQDNTECRNDAK